MAAKVLIVEDESIVSMSLQAMLEHFGYEVPAIATTAAEALQAIDVYTPDLMLLDIHLANGDDGIAVAEVARKKGDVPIIFVTAHSDPNVIARARATQPANFLLKPFNERELQIAVDLALARAKSERQLRASEQRFIITLRSIAEGVIVTDQDREITFVNPAAVQITRWTADDAIGRRLEEVFQPESRDVDLSHIASEVITTRRPARIPDGSVLLCRDGTKRLIVDSIAPLIDDAGHVSGAVLVFEDVTEQRRIAEEQQRKERKVLETQRLESLGVMAGGIAHDFNNLLTSILGHVELAQADLASSSEAYKYLEYAVNGINRSTELVGQMLDFTGRARFTNELINLNELITEMHALIQASIGRRVKIVSHYQTTLPLVEGDSTQLRQVMLNLLTNAAEAMEDTSGSITITTGSVLLTDTDLQRCVVGDNQRAGAYVFVSVQDTGSGIDDKTLARIFDPFFTTKFTGRGLGLSAMQGILRVHHGALRVQSTVGAGSTFTFYLPVAERAIKQSLDASHSQAKLRMHEVSARSAQRSTVLVVDDDEGMRVVTAQMLRRLDYNVVVAEDGPTALSYLQHKDDFFIAAIVDLVMPGMSGKTLIGHIQAVRPDLPIILMSGYSAEEISKQHIPGFQAFLQKPFMRHTLAATLENVIANDQDML